MQCWIRQTIAAPSPKPSTRCALHSGLSRSSGVDCSVATNASSAAWSPGAGNLWRCTCRRSSKRGSSCHRGMPIGMRGSTARWLKRGKRSMSRSRSSASTASQSGGRASHRTLVMIARLVGRSVRSQAASMALMSLTSTRLAAAERRHAGGRTRTRSRRPSHALPPNRETLDTPRRGSPSPRPARSRTRAR